jgi:D-alanyl-D-alanine carboxypeptidase (penicillin-binding protein 5/6)
VRAQDSRDAGARETATMSTFTTPNLSGEQRDRAARRRRLRKLAIGAVALAVGLGGVLTMTLASGSNASHRRTSAATNAGAARAPAPATAPPRSPAGLPLAAPALALAGLRSSQRNPVHLAFRHPPRAGLLFNLSSGRVLWQRNATRRLPIASLTKMMTALLAVRSGPPDAPVLVTGQAVHEGGSKVGELPLGRHVRLESLLYGLLLPSGNDAAVALAQHAAGSIDGFVARMNAEAARLGLGCTRYSSPSGFYDQGNFSCAADLAVLAHVDLQQPRIAAVTRTHLAMLPFPIKGGKLYLSNNNPLLVYGYPGASGLKTGYTIASGRCLVATAERHGVRLGVVLLHSPEPATQARRLLDRAFRDVYHLPVVPEPAIPAGA